MRMLQFCILKPDVLQFIRNVKKDQFFKVSNLEDGRGKEVGKCYL